MKYKVRVTVMAIETVVILLVAASGFLQAQTTVSHDHAKECKPAQSVCPVMGGEVNKKLFYDYQGKRIYVCCNGCIDQVKNDPEQYIKKIEESGQSVEILKTADTVKTPATVNALVPQKSCPVMEGKPVNKKRYVDHQGQRIYVCCPYCVSQVKKHPEQYLKKLSEMGEAPEKIPN